MLARCQQALLKLCHCKLKACKSPCQRHAIRLGIYNKKCDAVIKGMASLPGIYNVNKRNIKMFHSIQNPIAQDGLRLKKRRLTDVLEGWWRCLTVINTWFTGLCCASTERLSIKELCCWNQTRRFKQTVEVLYFTSSNNPVNFISWVNINTDESQQRVSCLTL